MISRNDFQCSKKELAIVTAVLITGIAIRMIHLNQPFVDHWSYRQTDTAQIAVNFFRNGWNIFSPQINWAGSSPGFVGTEFPIVPFLASLLYPIFGVQDWIGRSISIFFYAASIPALWLLVRRHADSTVALLTIAIYTLMPLSIFTSRSFMPDMAMLSCIIWALYAFDLWIEISERKHCIAAWLFTTLAILIKLPAITISIPFLYIAYRKYGWAFVTKVELWLFAITVLIPPALWYANGYLVSLSNPPYNLFGANSTGFVDLQSYLKIARRLTTKSMTIPISFLMIIGVILSIRRRTGLIFLAWLVAIVLFAIGAGKGVSAHEWYLLHVIPVSAFLSAMSIRFIAFKLRARSLRLVFIILLFLWFSYLSFAAVKGKYESWNFSARNMGLEIQQISAPTELIAVIDGGDSTALYYSNRKGWHFPPFLGGDTGSKGSIRRLEAIRKEGARYLAIGEYHKWWLETYEGFGRHLDANYKRVRDTPEYIIFDLRTKEGRAVPRKGNQF